MQSLVIISLFILAISSFLTLFVYSSRERNDERRECNGYRDMERIKKCGKEGYLIHYGLANCERFSRAVEKGTFDESGTRWVKCTTQCLIHKLVHIHQLSPLLSCSSMEDEAFSTHVPCYLDCNFCEICRSHKWGLLTTYRLSDFLNLNSFSQVYDVISQCGLFHCFT